jgi:hypothetical protein
MHVVLAPDVGTRRGNPDVTLDVEDRLAIERVATGVVAHRVRIGRDRCPVPSTARDRRYWGVAGTGSHGSGQVETYG